MASPLGLDVSRLKKMVDKRRDLWYNIYRKKEKEKKMFTTLKWIYVAEDGKNFFSKKECEQYEREKFPERRYVVTLQAAFTTVYEVEANSEEGAIEEARQEFYSEYNDKDYDVEALEIQCDDDEEED